MKTGQVLNLIASVCLFFSMILNLLNHFIDIPLILYFLSVPLLLAAIVLYGIALSNFKKTK